MDYRGIFTEAKGGKSNKSSVFEEEKKSLFLCVIFTSSSDYKKTKD